MTFIPIGQDQTPKNDSDREQLIAKLRDKVALLQKSNERSSRTLSVLHQTMLIIGTTSEVPRLLEEILACATELLNATLGGVIFIWDELQSRLVVVEGIGISSSLVGRFLLPGQGLAGRVFQSCKSILIEDYDRWEGRVVISSGITMGSAVGVPLIVNQHVIGVLMLSSEPGKPPFTTDDLNIVEMFAAQASIAYQRIQSLERLEHELAERRQLETRERELRALAQTMFDVTSILNASLKVDSVLDRILENIRRIAPADLACLFMVSGNTATAVRSRASEPAVAVFLQNWTFDFTVHPFFRRLMIEKRPLVFPNDGDDSAWMQPEINHLQSLLSAPITVRGELIGLIFLGTVSPNTYSEEYARRLQAFSNQASLAIYNARLHEEVQSLAITDPLTGVYNRRGFEQFGRQEINRAMRFARSVSMLFLDIDHFKDFNDRYSYEIGDKVLENVAGAAQATVRNVDLVGRYGGEEFVILTPEVDIEAAAQVAERLRARVESLRLATSFGDLGITISIGVASTTFPKYQTKPFDIKEEDLLEKMIQQAGHMLRKAKDTGRNRVCVDDDQGGSTSK